MTGSFQALCDIAAKLDQCKHCQHHPTTSPPSPPTTRCQVTGRSLTKTATYLSFHDTIEGAKHAYLTQYQRGGYNQTNDWLNDADNHKCRNRTDAVYGDYFFVRTERAAIK